MVRVGRSLLKFPKECREAECWSIAFHTPRWQCIFGFSWFMNRKWVSLTLAWWRSHAIVFFLPVYIPFFSPKFGHLGLMAFIDPWFPWAEVRIDLPRSVRDGQNGCRFETQNHSLRGSTYILMLVTLRNSKELKALGSWKKHSENLCTSWVSTTLGRYPSAGFWFKDLWECFVSKAGILRFFWWISRTPYVWHMRCMRCVFQGTKFLIDVWCIYMM